MVLSSNLIPFLESSESLLFIGGLKIFLAQFKVPKKLTLKNLPLGLGFGVWERGAAVKNTAMKMVKNMVKKGPIVKFNAIFGIF